MIKKIFKTAVILIASSIFIILLFPSCGPDSTYEAVIHVVDTAGNLVQGATVTLSKIYRTQYNGVNTHVIDTQITDASGTTTFINLMTGMLNITAKTTTKSGKGEINIQTRYTEQTINVY
jgi:hypothetical protein